METIEFRQSSLRDFLHVIFKRKNQILLFFAVTVFTVVAGTFVTKPAAVTFSDVPKQPVIVPQADTPDLPKENVEPKISAKDNKSPDITVPITEDEKMSQVVVKKGQNLFRIIIQTYGAYNDEILSKVLRANPNFIGPAQIHAGQTIKLPVVTKQSRNNSSATKPPRHEAQNNRR